jgi:hypothetical protein
LGLGWRWHFSRGSYSGQKYFCLSRKLPGTNKKHSLLCVLGGSAVRILFLARVLEDLNVFPFTLLFLLEFDVIIRQ